jgi:hypothetical protein
MPFEFNTAVDGGRTPTFELTWNPTGEAAQTPLMVRQVSLHQWVENDPTPDALGFDSYRQACLDRAERCAQQAWNRLVNGYEGDVPLGVYNGTWSSSTTDEWLSLVEIYEPRLREVEGIESGAINPDFQYEVTGSFVVYNDAQYGTGATFWGTSTQADYTYDPSNTAFAWPGVKQVGAFKRSQPGHLGKLGLMPYGVFYNYLVGTVAAPTDISIAMPTLVTLQPWMIEVGAYTAQPEFWLVDNL